MNAHHKALDFSLRHPWSVVIAVAVLFVALGSQIPRVVVDTDPENMLPADQGARVVHDAAKRDFTLYDMIVVGVVNEQDPDGVFNPASLERIDRLTQAILEIEGVVRGEVMSLSTVDNISQDGEGVVRFGWLMQQPPATRDEARAIRVAADRIPAIRGTLVSEDGKAAGIYIPIVRKRDSHRIATEIEAVIAGLGSGQEQYHVTGLPVAEDTFGVEMFKQMAIAAPLAGLVIFLLMWFFFRSPTLVAAPMILAIVTVTVTMGLLIGLGFTVHIMSSMIPIFLMPIAVVDSVHILSEFAELYPTIGNPRLTMQRVLNDLFTPMLYTSLTSAAGFASLASAPIPPVRVFGVFVAIGIALAFLLTITFIPACVMCLSESRLAGLRRREGRGEEPGVMVRLLARLAPKVLAAPKAVVAITVVVVAVSVAGVIGIEINDNPVRWFRPSHRIRIADRVLNQHFGGTYSAFLVLDKAAGAGDRDALVAAVEERLDSAARAGAPDLSAEWRELARSLGGAPDADPTDALIEAVLPRLDQAGEANAAVWEEVLAQLEEAESAAKVFQTPEALQYLDGLQATLAGSGLVGKSTALPDIVKTVHRELREGDPAYFTIPASAAGVAETLLSFQSSHRPDDLWHFVTPDYRSANLWLQLKSGDNRDMVQVTETVDRYIESNPPPDGAAVRWAGLTYLNVVWQQDMVSGMLNALIGSFVLVFVMMLVLFRSLGFATLAMLPLSVTILFIYGMIGLAGKDYDMPVAVLSALTLGLSVDFAIHFLERARAIQRETGDWHRTVERMFAEPALAIVRNAIVISVGFLPLLGSPLVPYNTVGFFMAAIMIVSCAVTLVLLPSLMDLMQKWLFRRPGIGREQA